jgi:hypothetical protein
VALFFAGWLFWTGMGGGFRDDEAWARVLVALAGALAVGRHWPLCLPL